MNKLKDLIKEIRPLIKSGYTISRQFKLTDKYSYEIKDNQIVVGIVGDNETVALRVFNGILREFNGEEIVTPLTNQLGWENSIEWLYNYYPYGEDNNSNCVLTNGTGRIIAIQYNGLTKTSTIKSIDCVVVPDYIVLNNKKKLSGEYYLKDIENILGICGSLFNN